jgi:hypothetical protein
VRRPLCIAAALAAAVVAAFALPQVASAAPSGFVTGFTSLGYGTGADATASYDQTVATGARLVVLYAPWASISPQPPPSGTDPTNPANPGYNWGSLDQLVRGAVAHGLRVVLSIASIGGPAWADGPNRPQGINPGTWRPNAAAFGAFVKAVARRYSGTFNPGTGTLPRVRYYEAWSEPNLDGFLAPAWVRAGGHWVAESPILYRGLLNAAYAAVKSVNRSNFVITGGLAGYGDPPGGHRVAPAVFLRELLCLHGEQLRPERCPNPARFDILDFHGYSVRGPWWRALNRDDASLADVGKLTRILTQAQRTRRVLPRAHKPVWVLEFAWDSNPPDPTATPMSTWSHWLEESFYVAWHQGVSAMAWTRLRDLPCVPVSTCDFVSRSGVYFVNGQPKPGFEAFRFPFVVEPAGRGRAVVWGITPRSGTVLVQVLRRGAWRTITSFRRSAHGVFTRTVALSGRSLMRARVGAETSLSWQFR